MKALFLLIELRENDYKLGASKDDLKVYDEAIAELEEALKPKSCSACKHYDGSHACLKWNSIAYKSELRVYPNDGCLQEYEPKANK